jgi:hypothetical protein
LNYGSGVSSLQPARRDRQKNNLVAAVKGRRNQRDVFSAHRALSAKHAEFATPTVSLQVMMPSLALFVQEDRDDERILPGRFA